MRRTTIITEEEWIKIESPHWVASGHGYCDEIEGVTYFDEPYIDEVQKEKLLEKANAIYKEKYARLWMKEPRVDIYWKEIN